MSDQPSNFFSSGLRQKVDQLMDILWSGGVNNPMDSIEQCSYLLFLRLLTEKDEILATLDKKQGTAHVVGACQPCRNDIPHVQLLQRLFRVYADRDVRGIAGGDAALMADQGGDVDEDAEGEGQHEILHRPADVELNRSIDAEAGDQGQAEPAILADAGFAPDGLDQREDEEGNPCQSGEDAGDGDVDGRAGGGRRSGRGKVFIVGPDARFLVKAAAQADRHAGGDHSANGE